MICPICDTPDINVIDSRHFNENLIYRRRECINKHRFTTYESIKPSNTLIAKREIYQREKP